MLKNSSKILSFVFVLCLAGGVYAQVNPPKQPKQPTPPSDKTYKDYRSHLYGDSEKSIAVAPAVTVKLCVSEGILKINGWERNEVRVFVKSGSKIGLKVLEKNPESGKPNWLWVKNQVNGSSTASDCLAGSIIELDVPMTANLDLSGRTSQTSIDSVKKVKVKIVEGVITLRNITGGISAYTHQGDVMVENSGGAISVESSTGNIIAFEVSPGQIGDLFSAKTNSGTISIQKVEHRQIEANSITGSVAFNGKFLPGGLYDFKTTNGSIKLTIPADSSVRIAASYGFGTFNFDVPMKLLTENVSPGGKNVTGIIGSGEATVKMTTSSGSIGIRKQ